MSIDVDKPNRQKVYWLSINGKFFKKKLNTHILKTSLYIICIFINSIKNLLLLIINNR